MSQVTHSQQAAAFISRTNRYILACAFLRDIEDWIAQEFLRRVRAVIEQSYCGPTELKQQHSDVTAWREATKVYMREALNAAYRYEHEGNQLKHLEELEKFIALIKA